MRVCAGLVIRSVERIRDGEAGQGAVDVPSVGALNLSAVDRLGITLHPAGGRVVREGCRIAGREGHRVYASVRLEAVARNICERVRAI